MKEELTAERKRYRLAGTLEAMCARKWGICAVSRRIVFSSETSSYARALQGEPVPGFTHFARHQTVASQLPF